MAENKGFGVLISAEVQSGSGAENKFAKQLQTMVDRIPDSKLPKITVQIDATRTRQIFQKQLNEIMKSLSLDTSQLNKLTNGTSNAQKSDKQKAKEYQKYLNDLAKEYDALDERIIAGKNARYKNQINEQIKEDKRHQDSLKITAKITAQSSTKLVSVDSFESQLKSAKKYSEELERVRELYKSAINPKDMNAADLGFKRLKQSAKEAGDIGLGMGEKFKEGLAKFAGWYGIARIVTTTISVFKKMISSVIELDASLVEIQKVTDLSGASLKRFTSQAFELGSQIGRTGKEVIDAVAEFRRAGYELTESMNLSKAALVMTNVGDGINDTAEASSYLISVLRGFDIDSSSVMNIVDMINETSNNAPITFSNIAEGLRRSSAVLAQTGTSLEETIGLLTGGFASLRDIEGVSGGLNMISARLRGIDEDGQAIDGLAPKIAKEFKEIANIDIEDSNGELRSTYDILSDMARIFPTLNSKQRQYLGELAAGNRQVKVLNAILAGWKDVEKAVNSASNSQDSAAKENAIFMDSIQGKINAFTTEFQKMSQVTINSDLIKGVVSLGTGILSLVNATTGLIPLLVSIGSIVASIKFESLSTIVSTLFPKLVTGFQSSALAAKLFGTSVTGATVATTALTASITLGLSIAIMAAIKAYKHFNSSIERQKEKVEELSSSFNEYESKLNSTKDQLLKITEKIDDINNQPFSISNEAELESLKKTTSELEMQILLLEKKQQLTKQDLAKESENLFNKQYSDNNFTQSSVDMYRLDDNIVGLTSNNNNIDALIAGYEKIKLLKEEAALVEDWQGVERYSFILSEVEQQLLDQIPELENIRLNISSLENPSQKQLDIISKTSNGIELIQKTLFSEKWKDNKFLEIFNSQEFARSKDKLLELAQTGKLDESVILSYKKFVELINETGLTAAEIASEINSNVSIMSSSFKQMSDIMQIESDDFKKLNTDIDNIQSTYKTLSNAVDEYNANGSLSIDTTQAIISLGDDYIGMLFDENGQINLNSDSLVTLAHAKLDELEATALRNAINNIETLEQEQTSSEKLSKASRRVTEAKIEESVATLELAKAKALESGVSEESIDRIVEKFEQYKLVIDKTRDALGSYLSGAMGGFQKSSSTNSLTSEFDKQLKYLQYLRDRNIIDQESYLNRLEALNNNFFERDSENWRKYELEIYQGRKSLQEAALKQQAEAYINAISINIDELNKKIKASNEYYDKRIKNLKSEKDAVKDFYDDIVKNLDKEKDVSNDYYDGLIDSLQEQKKALKESVDEETRLLNIEKARVALAKSESQRTVNIYREGQGFVWETDLDVVKANQDALTSLEKDYQNWQIERSIDNQIDKYKEMKKAAEESFKAQIENHKELKEEALANLDLQIDKYQEMKEASEQSFKSQIEDLENLKSNIQNSMSEIGMSLDEHNNKLKLSSEAAVMNYNEMTQAAKEYALALEKLREEQARSVDSSANSKSTTSSSSNSSTKTTSINSQTSSSTTPKSTTNTNTSTTNSLPNKYSPSLISKGGKASGDKSISESGVYNVNEKGEELFLTAPNEGEYKWLNKTDMVIPHEARNHLFEFAENPSKFLKRYISNIPKINTINEFFKGTNQEPMFQGNIIITEPVGDVHALSKAIIAHLPLQIMQDLSRR